MLSLSHRNNPIFIEYYPHEETDCYKICIPWAGYGEYKFVLCKVSEGLEKAKIMAKKVLTEHLEKCFDVREIRNADSQDIKGDRVMLI